MHDPIEERKNNNSNGLGIALGFLIWGFACLVFMRAVSVSEWMMWILYIIGFLLLLMGFMGLCIEIPKLPKGEGK